MSKTLGHKSDLNKLFVKCTEKHEKMLGKNFDFKRALCYQWEEEERHGLKVKKVWKVQVFDVVENHELFVHMGVIGRINLAL